MTQLGYQGFEQSNTSANEYLSLSFLVNQILSKVNVATQVKVVAVTNNGGVSPVGYVDVQPLVNQMDGAGNSMPHGVVHNLPYFRLQGGANAVIIDPKVGDIGVAVFGDRDLSAVQNTKAQSNPGSGRRFDMADGLYFGGFSNQAPSQYVQFTATGINVVSPTKITCAAPNIEMDAATGFSINSPAITLNGALTQGQGSYAGNSTMGGTLTVTVDVIGGGKHLATHQHGGVQTGSGNTGAPI